MKRPKRLTRKRTISIILLCSFLGMFSFLTVLPDSFFIKTPQLIATQAGTSYSHIWLEGPPISFRYEVTFIADGSISVNNPVHVKVRLKQMNITNFLDFYSGVTFSRAYEAPIRYKENQIISSVIIELNKMEDGTYFGEKDVVWGFEGPSYMTEVIREPEGKHIPSTYYENSTAVVNVSGVSDTLALHFTANTNRLTWQIGSFSIIVLQPILEAIFLREEKKKSKRH